MENRVAPCATAWGRTLNTVKYEFTPEDDRLTFEVNAVICQHPELFREAARQIDLLYSIDAIRERLEKPITDETRASMVGNARRVRDRPLLRSLFPPHRRDLVLPKTRFSYLVRDFFDRPHPPIPSPGVEWASDKLLRYWLLTSPDADSEASPPLTEFQKWPWEGDIESGEMGRYMMQWLDSTGSIWPDALRAVRRALDVVKQSIACSGSPDPRSLDKPTGHARPMTKAEVEATRRQLAIKCAPGTKNTRGLATNIAKSAEARAMAWGESAVRSWLQRRDPARIRDERDKKLAEAFWEKIARAREGARPNNLGDVHCAE